MTRLNRTYVLMDTSEWRTIAHPKQIKAALETQVKPKDLEEVRSQTNESSGAKLGHVFSSICGDMWMNGRHIVTLPKVPCDVRSQVKVIESA